MYVYDWGFPATTAPDVAQTTGGYRAFNGSAGSLAGGRVAPYQSFFVRTTAAVPNLEIPSSAKVTTATPFYGKNENVSGVLQLQALSGNRFGEAWFSFTESGDINLDRRDGYKLSPLDFQPYLNLASSVEGQLLDINNLPLDLQTLTEVPLHVELLGAGETGWVAESGEVTLTWPSITNIPAHWTLALLDRQTGARIDLRETTSYRFTVTPSLGKTLERAVVLSPTVMEVMDGPRMVLQVGPGSVTSVEGHTGVELALAQNYPNPATGRTEIRYVVPEAAEVRLQVFDVLGREVSTLVEGTVPGGSHTASLDSSTLAPGVYLYRLEVGPQVLTRRFTVAR